MTPSLRLPAQSPKAYAAWASTLGRWERVSKAAALLMATTVAFAQSTCPGPSLESLLTRRSLEEARCLSVCSELAHLFLTLNDTYTHTHTHTCTHARPAPRAHTFHCVLENKEAVCMLFGAEHNTRLKLLFCASESYTRQTHALHA